MSPPENETESDRIARVQRELDAFRTCVSDELQVRAETSLLTLVLFKVVVPVIAVGAGFGAVYASILRSGRSATGHPELALGIGYLVITTGAILLWRSRRQPGSGGRVDAFDRSIRRALRIAVPPSKEKITRNNLVNRWIFFWATWGMIIGLPLIFFLFRANVLDRAGIHLTFDTANVCAPTAEGFDPYAGSGVCDNRGYTYVDPNIGMTSSATGAGVDAESASLAAIPSHSIDDFHTAEVRMDVTTTLVLYFAILIGGILVNMARWVRRDKQRKLFASQAPNPPPAEPAHN